MSTIKKYSVSQTAQMLSLSKDTLRYYDKIGLVQPGRGDNRYRFYTDDDLLVLQYVEVMKFAGLSLSEVGKILHNRTGQSEENKQSTLSILKKKRVEIKRKIQLYQELEQMVHQAVQTVETKTLPSDMAIVDGMVQRLYKSIGKDNINEE